MKVTYTPACDACGDSVLAPDEILCEPCKSRRAMTLPPPPPEPLRNYVLCDTGDACYVVAVYDRAAFEAAIGEPLTPNAHRYACVSDTAWYEAEALTGMVPFERGVGRPFGSTMTLKVFGKKVLARQFRGLDV